MSASEGGLSPASDVGTESVEPRPVESRLPQLARPSMRTAHASVTDLLRSSIMTGKLAAGTRLVQSELADMLSVSITPIREALRQLTTEGLVDFDAFRGAIVHMPSTNEMRDLYEVRRALIPINVRKGVARITPEELAEASRLADEMTTADDESWVVLNLQFHNVLDNASANAHLAAILSRLSILSGLYVNLCVGLRDTYRDRAAAEHLQLVEAYSNGDVERAVDLNLRHLAATVDAAEAAFPTGNDRPNGQSA